MSDNIYRNVRKDGTVTYTARVVIGRDGYAGQRTFGTLRAARAWQAHQRAQIRGGVDAAAGKLSVADAVALWLQVRSGNVAPKTLVSDEHTIGSLPRWFARLQVRDVAPGQVARLLREWGDSVGRESVVRRRATLSTFFEWLVLEMRAVPTNPVRNVRAPRRLEAPSGKRPLSEVELEAVAQQVLARGGERLAEVVLLLGWTGLRWGEARELRVRDVVELPLFSLRVQRSRTECQPIKVPKSGKGRTVPIAPRIADIVLGMAAGKGPDDLLVTTDRGATLHRTRFIASSGWEVASDGRRLHDLRHTAICLWLARGVAVPTAQAWAGHSSIAVTNEYVSYLGTDADRVALTKLNWSGVASEKESDEGGSGAR